VKNMVEQERGRLAAILQAGGIAVSDETLCVLWEGVTPTELQAETFKDHLRRKMGVGGGLAAITIYYSVKAEAFHELSTPLNGDLKKLARCAKQLEVCLRNNSIARYLTKFTLCDEDELGSLSEMLQRLQRVDARRRPGASMEPATFLFASLHDLFVRLGGRPGIGRGGPFYEFAKAAAALIDPDLAFPTADVFRDRLQKHRQKFKGKMTPWIERLVQIPIEDIAGGNKSPQKNYSFPMLDLEITH
jgi:hypothetical protein